MTSIYNYRYYCPTEDTYRSDWGTEPPTNCPTDSAVIDQSTLSIIQTGTTGATGINNSIFPLTISYAGLECAGLETSSSYYTRVGSFIYEGTLVDVSPLKVYWFLYTTKSTVSYTARIQDVTHNQTICTSATSNTGTEETPEVLLTTSFANLPTEQSILEIQLKSSSNSSHKVGISTMQIYR